MLCVTNTVIKRLLIPCLAVSLYIASGPGSAGVEPLKPLSEPEDLNMEKVELGRKLFHETRLSKDNSVSCASCHDLAAGGADNREVSIGIENKKGMLNSPTVYNSGLLFSNFWDGRADSLEDQIDGPIQADHEMGSLWPEVIAKLYDDDEYPDQFSDIYPDGITRKNIKDCIAEFERSLNAVDSPFDRYLKGDEYAISKKARKGYERFKFYGCASCHQGENVGGNLFQVFGVVNSYFEKRGNITKADRGRFNVTGNPEDMHRFKVPSLRMVSLTPPYLHDGQAKTLREAVDIMFTHQLGREAPDEDKDAIVEFLKTLAGKHKELK